MNPKPFDSLNHFTVPFLRMERHLLPEWAHSGHEPHACRAWTRVVKESALADLDLVCSGSCFSVSRSEEHTSELQSLRHLVCRLLLEKKNKYYTISRSCALVTAL